MVVSLAAHAQYDDMRGTVTLDDGDFEDLQSVLGISGRWHLLGFSVFCNHPSLGIEGKDSADTTYTSIRAWALSDELLTAHSNERGFAGVIDALRPLPIAEFEVVSEHHMVRERDAWVEEQTQY